MNCPVGKVGYGTRVEANRAMGAIRRRRNRTSGRNPGYVYPCRHCEQWHLGVGTQGGKR